MENRIARKTLDMVAQAALLAKGADEHGATVNLGQNTAVNIRADINAVTAALAAYALADEELSTRRGSLRLVRFETRALLLAARDSFKGTLGQRYNQRWDGTGLLGSLEIPETK